MVLWRPAAATAANSLLTAFQTTAEFAHGFMAVDYEQLWQWSVEHPDEFWRQVWDFFHVQGSGDLTVASPHVPVGSGSPMSGAGWFPHARLNYAEQVFARRDDSRPALLACGEDRDPVQVSWAELSASVAALAERLREWAVEPGDRVAGYLPNIAAAVVGLLAAASVGAVWACCAPEYGTQAVIDRLTQIEPTVLIAVDGYRYGGQVVDRTSDIAMVVAKLPTLRHVVLVSHVGTGMPDLGAVPATAWADALAVTAELAFDRVPFGHPLWILYSSGTTGLPKGIVHGHGGIVLEHLKWLGLHNDVRPADRFFWYTSTGWMVWNVVVGSLLLGATAVLYDGSPAYPAPDAVWELAASAKASYLGTSAGYIMASQKKELEPGRDHDFSALRCLMSTGSVLPVDGWRWVYEHVSPEVWLDAPSGGTDVCTAYVGGCPTKPVIAGEIQARLLGTRVEAYSEDARSVVGEVGELVITAPMPSMPLRFWADPDGSRYQQAYFDTFPGVWRHGDWITITERGTVRVHGRSDATINRHGVRMGSSEIRAAAERLPEVRESLVIGAEIGDGSYYMPLFVVLESGILDDALRERIAEQIRVECSRRHVPDEILQVPAIPHTITGKSLEVPIKRLLQGVPMERAVSTGVVDDPSLLNYYVQLGARLGRARQASRAQ